MPARFGPLPASAAWRLRDALEGFEVVFPESTGDGYRLDGSTTAVEGGPPWTGPHEIVVGEGWGTLPVHRLALGVGQEADAPAAYVRWLDLRVERLEQHYVRVDDSGTRQRFHYTAPVFHYDDHLVYDGSGLVLDYPGIGTRVL